jgi:hypothetical protein
MTRAAEAESKEVSRQEEIDNIAAPIGAQRTLAGGAPYDTVPILDGVIAGVNRFSGFVMSRNGEALQAFMDSHIRSFHMLLRLPDGAGY